MSAMPDSPTIFPAEAFRPVSTSIAPSQDTEVFLTRQSALGPYRNACADVLMRLDNDVATELVNGYRPLEPQVWQQVYDAIAQREYNAGNMTTQAPDMEWLSSAQTRNQSDVAFLAGDEWFSPGL